MPSNFFGHLKRSLGLLISVIMSPLSKIYDHWVDTIITGKKKKKKKKTHAPAIGLLAKITKFHIFFIGA